MERSIFPKQLLLLVLVIGLIPFAGCSPNIQKLEDKQDIKGLIKILGTNNAEKIREAQDALIRIGEPSVDLLITAIKDQNVKLRIHSPVVLGEIGDDRAVSPLITALRDANFTVRDNAALALGEIGDVRAIQPLIIEYGFGMESAGGALQSIGEPVIEPLINALESEFQTHRERYVDLLVQFGEPAIDPLIGALYGQSRYVKESAALALVRIGGLAVGPLIEALDGEEKDVRSSTINLLGRIGDERAIEPLIPFLREPELAADAVKALDLIGWEPEGESEAWYWVAKNEFLIASELGSAAVEPLTDAMLGYTSDDLIAALVQIGEPAVESLIPLLSDAEGLCFSATNVLVRIGEPAVAPLINSFKNEDVRNMSSNVLLQIGEPAVLPLIAALENEDTFIREQAAFTLGNIGDIRAVEPLIILLNDADAMVREKAARALGKIGDKLAVNALIAVLKDENENVRSNAAYALGKIGDNLALQPLIGALSDQNDIVVKNAITALGEIGDVGAVQPLIAALLDEETQKESEGALIKICQDQPPVLVPYLNYSTTFQVYRVLIRLGDSSTVSALINTLNRFGTTEMALIYLTCVNGQLEDAGEEWLEANGYWVMQRGEGGSEGYRWGE